MHAPMDLSDVGKTFDRNRTFIKMKFRQKHRQKTQYKN